jgi:hypothetical protein
LLHHIVGKLKQETISVIASPIFSGYFAVHAKLFQPDGRTVGDMHHLSIVWKKHSKALLVMIHRS